MRTSFTLVAPKRLAWMVAEEDGVGPVSVRFVAWLVRGGDVLCSLDVADTVAERMRGLLGRDGLDGAILLTHCRSVHTLGMRFPIDVAFLSRTGKVVAVVAPMRPWRLGRARVRARQVLEAEAGMFDRWRLAVGDVLEVERVDAAEQPSGT